MNDYKLRFPNEKIKTEPSFRKNRNIKREAVLLNGRYLCPLCFKEDRKTLSSSVVTIDLVRKIKFTARCNNCGIKITYIKDVPRVE